MKETKELNKIKLFLGVCNRLKKAGLQNAFSKTISKLIE